jgi:hypothetical protein
MSNESKKFKFSEQLIVALRSLFSVSEESPKRFTSSEQLQQFTHIHQVIHLKNVFDAEFVNLLIAYMQKLSFKEVAPVFSMLNTQVEEVPTSENVEKEVGYSENEV